jgi:hypothetical protein
MIVITLMWKARMKMPNRPWWPSHTIFGKSSIKQSQIDAMKGRYFRDISIMRVGGTALPLHPRKMKLLSTEAL